ncbi:MAG: nucleotide exchange factor GrpE [Gemmatimonadales bacterium]
MSAVHRLREQLDAARDQHLRLAADFDNFRKRVARERLELSDRAQAGLVIRLLEVLDDLDRMAAADAATPGETVRQAVELVDKKLRKELEAAGLERVDPVGARFDPAESEAVSVVEAPEPELDDQVAMTFQVGYRFKGALVRPARVQVYSTDGQV